MSFVEMSAVLGNLGEFTGSVAVLITLIYLAVQVRQSRDLLLENRKIALSQVYQHRANLRSEMHRSIAESGELSDMMAGLSAEKLETMTEGEKLRVRHQLTRTMIMVDNIRFQTELGLLQDSWRDEGVLDLYSMWEQADLDIMPRLREWRAMVDAAEKPA